MQHTVYSIVSESLQEELRAIDFYLLAADVAPTPAARLAAQQFAKEEEQHLDALIERMEWEDDSELRTVLQNIHLLCYAASRHTDAVRRWLDLCGQEDISGPVQMLYEIAIAKERKSIGYYHALERRVTEPAARRVLRTICYAEEQHKRFLEDQYHRLVSEPAARGASWH